MRNMIGLLLFLVCGLSLYALPENFIGRQGRSANFISDSTNDIATAVFQVYDVNETNFVFSPFGYSVILAILSEGANGNTKSELTNALHLPEKIKDVRQVYASTLSRMSEKLSLNKPEFKNFFYVYENFTVDQSYKDTLFKYYATEVKNTDRPDDYFNSPAEGDDQSVESKVTVESSSTRSEQKSANYVTQTPNQAPISGGLSLTDVKDATEKAAELLSLEKDLTSATEEIGVSKIRKERIKRMAKRFLGIDLEKKSSNEVASLSANNVYTGKYNAKLSRMLIFNGLYFKGSWQVPFQNKQTEDAFYISQTDKKSVKMIYSVGKFFSGEIPDLDSVALKIPYKGERYSFLIIIPKKGNSLSQLTRDLTGYSLRNIPQHLEEKHMQVSIPTFDFKTISHMKQPLNKLGVNGIFTEEADFSGINPNSGLYVDDLVQLVTVKVDNETGTTNFLSASSVGTRTVTEKFIADRPFLFFIQDHKDDILVAAGKVLDPTVNEV